MTEFSQTEFNQFVINNEIVGFFDLPVRLVSGRETQCYVNWRNAVADVYLSDQLADYVLAYTQAKELSVDTYYGTPDGATKLAVICQYKHAKSATNFGPGSHALAMGRKYAKDHGESKDRFFVGAPRGKTLVIEDVTSTGGSLLESVKSLQALEIEVAGALALTNRNQVMKDGRHVSQALAELGVEYLAMSNLQELLPTILEIKKPGEAVKKSLIDEFKQVGVEPLVL